MDRGMGREKAGASHGRRPKDRPPGASRQGEARHQKGGADVLDEMRIVWPGVGDSGDAVPPARAGKQHHEPVGDISYCQNCCEPSLHAHLLR